MKIFITGFISKILKCAIFALFIVIRFCLTLEYLTFPFGEKLLYGIENKKQLNNLSNNQFYAGLNIIVTQKQHEKAIE
jgi:hypothetical protein